METTLQLTHERVDDVPLLLGFLIKLRFPQLLDQFLPPHPLHQGLSQGWLITLWITYILSQADHRKSPVRDWVNALAFVSSYRFLACSWGAAMALTNRGFCARPIT